MNPFRKYRKASAVVSPREFTWVYGGQRFTFYALNVPDLHAQVRASLSAHALREGFLG